MKKQIPNLFTLGNVFCGCLAIVYAFKQQLDISAILVIIAAILDFFDGFLARLLKVTGELGKQLDSLADMVTFGVVPGVVVFVFTQELNQINTIIPHKYNWVFFLAFIIPLLSAYRLAKFNIDTRQTTSFIGLPTPANALFFISIPFIYKHNDLGVIDSTWVVQLFANPLLLLGLSVIFSLFLISEIPMFALKFKSYVFNQNKLKYTFILCSIVCLILMGFNAIPIIVLLYILISITQKIFIST